MGGELASIVLGIDDPAGFQWRQGCERGEFGVSYPVPLIPNSSYVPPKWFTSGHAQTVFPTLARCVRGVRYTRERLELKDHDFLDLDWSLAGTTRSRRVVIISHGLEGDSNRVYVTGMVRAMNRGGWDAVAWNFRGCSGVPNRIFRLYHSGLSEDLDAVVQHVRKWYDVVVLVGFSLGGNLTLKYLGELGEDAPPKGVRGGAVFSVPCDLGASSDRIASPENRFYMRRFLQDLKGKILMKAAQYPEKISVSGFERIRTFREFDDRYTAPMHGFRDAADYYEQCSSGPWVSRIRVPTLLVNALDDPFLTQDCSPVEAARQSADFHLELPHQGGHVGFIDFKRGGDYWSESRAREFLGTVVG